MSQKMSWEEIRQQYPDTFVLLDNCEEAKVTEDKVMVHHADVVLTSSDGKVVYEEYCKRGKPNHMTFAHTNWQKLEIQEIFFMGLRPLHV